MTLSLARQSRCVFMTGLLVVAGCVSGNDAVVPASTGAGIGNPAATTAPPVVTSPPRTTTSLGPGFVEGTLPDGTDYRVTGLPAGGEQVTGIQSVIVLDDGESVQTIGAPQIVINNLSPDPDQLGGSWPSENLYVIQLEGAAIQIPVAEEHIFELLGPTAQEIIAQSIGAHVSLAGFPVLDLAWPFRLAEDLEVPSYMEVSYETFTVMRGCYPDLDGICAEQVQVVPLSSVMAPAPPGPPAGIGIERVWSFPSNATRFDEGPLEPRGGHASVWTGTELLVWGGSGYEGGPLYDDGAAFDPSTGTWRLVSASPLNRQTKLIAEWTGAEALIIGPRGGAAYGPVEDTWRPIAAPPFSVNGLMAHVWTGDHLVVWSADNDAVTSYDPATDTWGEVAAVGLEGDVANAELRFTEDRLYALGTTNPTLETPCVTSAAMFDGDSWQPLAASPVCVPYITAFAGRVYGFSGSERLLGFDPDLGRWIDLPAPPFHDCESFPTPLSTGQEILFFDWCDHSALYDPNANSWREIALPDDFSMTNALWTGTEVMSWGDYCCYGAGDVPLQVSAWRLTP